MQLVCCGYTFDLERRSEASTSNIIVLISGTRRHGGYMMRGCKGDGRWDELPCEHAVANITSCFLPTMGHRQRCSVPTPRAKDATRQHCHIWFASKDSRDWHWWTLSTNYERERGNYGRQILYSFLFYVTRTCICVTRALTRLQLKPTSSSCRIFSSVSLKWGVSLFRIFM